MWRILDQIWGITLFLSSAIVITAAQTDSPPGITSTQVYYRYYNYAFTVLIVISFPVRAGLVVAIVVPVVVITIVLSIATIICVVYSNRYIIERYQQGSSGKLHSHALCKIIAVATL